MALEELERKQLEIQIKKIKEEIEELQQREEDIEQDIKRMKDDIEEVDDTIFNVTKVKEDKEKTLEQAKKSKQLTVKEAQVEEYQREEQLKDPREDIVNYKTVLVETLQTQLDTIKLYENQQFDELHAEKRLDVPEKPRVPAVHAILLLSEKDNIIEGFQQMYIESEEDKKVELRHSFALSTSSSMERLKVEACRYWGLNHSVFQLCYRKDSGYAPLSKYVFEKVDTSLADSEIKFQAAEFFLIRKGSDLLEEQKVEEKKKSAEKESSKRKDVPMTDEQIEREKLLSKYHGFNYLIGLSNEEETEKYTLGYKTTFLSAMVVSVLLILTAVCFFKKRDSIYHYWSAKAIQRYLRENSVTINLQQIATISDTWHFLNTTFYNSLYEFDSFKEKNTINHVRIRTLRTKKKDLCVTGFNQNISCYYAAYTKQTRDDQDFHLEGVPEVWYWRSSTENQESDSITGQFSSYDGSGIVTDIPVFNSTGEELKRFIRLGMENKFLNEATRAIIIKFSYYNAALDLICTITSLLEFSVAGGVKSSFLSARVFPPSLRDTTTEKVFFALDIIRVIISFYFLVIMAIVINFYKKKTKLISLSCLVDAVGYMLIPGIAMAVMALTVTFSKKEPKELIESTTFVDNSGQALYYDAIFGLEAVFLAVLVFRLFSVFRLNAYFNLIFKTIDTAFGFLITYAVLFFCFMLGCAILSQNLWGTYDSDYTGLYQAFVASCLTIIGNIDYSKWLFRSSDWALIYFILFFIWIIFLLPSVFIGIFMSSYRVTTLGLGYPEDKKGERWGWKEYLSWMLGWCPCDILHKLGLPKLEDAARERDKKKDQQ